MPNLSRRHFIAIPPSAALLASASTAQSPAGGAQDLRLQPGVHQIARNTTIAGDVQLAPGAQIEVAPGATLTLLGHFDAPVAHVFTGAGRVDLALGRTREAFPEWWGAVGEDAAVDSWAAIQACLAAHPIMRLGPHSYFVSRTVSVDQSNRRITGSGQRWLKPGSGTRIVLTGQGDVMRLGSPTRPASINDFAQGLVISDFQLARAQPAAGEGHDGPAGLRARYLLFSDISRIDSAESVNGFAVGGVVRTYFRDCTAFRSPAGGSRSTVFRGFACDGSVEIGLAGGNGSVFFVDCNARTGGEPLLSESVGMLLDHAFADTLVTNFETAAMAVGIRLQGQASRLSRDKQRTGHADVRIQAPVLDQCSQVGLDIEDTSDHALVDISDPYVAAASGAAAALRFSRARGQTTVRGGQLIGLSAGSRTAGIAAADSDGIELSGLKLLGFDNPARFTRCRDVVADLAINHPDGSSGAPAVQLTDCAQTRIALRIKGRASAYDAAVAVDGTATQQVAVDLTGVAPPAIGGSDRMVTAPPVLRGRISVRP